MVKAVKQSFLRFRHQNYLVMLTKQNYLIWPRKTCYMNYETEKLSRYELLVSRGTQTMVFWVKVLHLQFG